MGLVRESEFRRMVDEEFGPGHGAVLLTGHVLMDLGGATPVQALAAGVPARRVWLALCRDLDVPQERWLGRDIPISEGGAGD